MISSTMGYLYVLINPAMPKGVVKVGRTKDPRQRLSGYPKGSRYVYISPRLVDCHSSESALLSKMKRDIELYTGNEYFLCKESVALKYIHDLLDCDPCPMRT